MADDSTIGVGLDTDSLNDLSNAVRANSEDIKKLTETNARAFNIFDRLFGALNNNTAAINSNTNANTTAQQANKAVKDALDNFNNSVRSSASSMGSANTQLISVLNKAFNNTSTNNTGFLSGAMSAIRSRIPTPYSIGRDSMEFLLKQISTMLSDFFSWAKLSGAYAAARRAEATIGNYRNEDLRFMDMEKVTRFNLEMSQLGAKTEEATKALQDYHSRGLTGINASTAAIGDQALKQVFGQAFGADTVSKMLRASATSADPLMRTGLGNYTVAGVGQALAMISKTTESTTGLQAGFTTLMGITTNLVNSFKGMGNSLTNLLSDLGSFGRLLAENNMTQEEVQSMMRISQTTSAQQQYAMLAFAGVSGSNLLEARERFRVAGLTDRMGDNARLAARAGLNLYNQIRSGTGTDLEARSLFQDAAGTVGLGGIVKNLIDPIKTLTEIAKGSQSALEAWQEAGRTDHDVLVSTAKGIEAILDPLKAIRNMVAGILMNFLHPFTPAEKAMEQFGGWMSKHSDNLESVFMSWSSGNRAESILTEIAHNTREANALSQNNKVVGRTN